MIYNIKDLEADTINLINNLIASNYKINANKSDSYFDNDSMTFIATLDYKGKCNIPLSVIIETVTNKFSYKKKVYTKIYNDTKVCSSVEYKRLNEFQFTE